MPKKNPIHIEPPVERSTEHILAQPKPVMHGQRIAIVAHCGRGCPCGHVPGGPRCDTLHLDAEWSENA